MNSPVFLWVCLTYLTLGEFILLLVMFYFFSIRKLIAPGCAKLTLEAFYFSFGENDFYIIVDLPDNVSTTAVTFAGNISGTFRINGVALLTAEELDEAIKKSVDFRPPGH